MADGGGFVSGLIGGMQAAQQLQLGKLAEQQQSVQLQQSQIQLRGLQKMMDLTSSRQFQQELASGPSGADAALGQLQNVQLEAGMTEAAGATARMRYEQSMSSSHATAEQALAASRTAATVQNILSSVDPTNPASLAAAKMQIQWVLPPTVDPKVRKYYQGLTMDQLPQGIQAANIVLKHSQAAAAAARTKASNAQADLYEAESTRAAAQAKLADAQRTKLEKDGGLQPKQYAQIQTEIENRLEAAHPMPTWAVTGIKSTDTANRRANWKAQYAASAGDVADQVLVLMQKGMSRADAVNKAYSDADKQGRFKVFDAMAGQIVRSGAGQTAVGHTFTQKQVADYAEQNHMSIEQVKQQLIANGYKVE